MSSFIVKLLTTYVYKIYLFDPKSHYFLTTQNKSDCYDFHKVYMTFMLCTLNDIGNLILTVQSWQLVLYENLRLTTFSDSSAAPLELLELKPRRLNDSSHRVIRGMWRGPHESTAKKSP